MENTNNEPQNNDSIISDWLLKKIEALNKKLGAEKHMDVKMWNGGKLATYREWLEYINTLRSKKIKQ